MMLASADDYRFRWSSWSEVQSPGPAQDRNAVVLRLLWSAHAVRRTVQLLPSTDPQAQLHFHAADSAFLHRTQFALQFRFRHRWRAAMLAAGTAKHNILSKTPKTAKYFVHDLHLLWIYNQST
jgi:hypothetical protein